MESAVILAGGRGTRLKPLTDEVPKPLVDIDGRNLIEHKLLILKDVGIETVYLAIGYMSDKVIDFFGDEYEGMKIKYVVEEEPLGTGGWMHLVNRDDFRGDFIVTNADDLSRVDFDSMHDEHVGNDALITLSLSEIDDPRAHGVARLDGDRIVEFVEKPETVEEAPSNLISDGHYIFSPEVFGLVPDDKRFMLEHDLFPVVCDMKKLFSFRNENLWLTTNTKEQLFNVRENWEL